MSDINDELRKMIELEDATLKTTKSITTIYKGFIEAGMPENITLELIKFWMAKAMDQGNVVGGSDNDE